MMFSSKSRYALRVMLDLARQSADGYVPLNDIVVRQNISRKYLEAIMNALCKGRLVDSTVGKSGGYRLLRPPAEYTPAKSCARLRATPSRRWPVWPPTAKSATARATAAPSPSGTALRITSTLI